MKVEPPLIPSRLRLGLTLVIVVIIISSSIVLLSFKHPHVLANPGVTDTSSDHATLPMSEQSSPFIPSLSTPTTQAALSDVNARPTNNIVSVNSYYDIIFTTATAGIIKFIDITFPAGTVIGAAPLLLVEKEGIGAGTATKVSNTEIRYTVTSAVNVPAGTKIRLELFNIVNPPIPSSYKAAVTTKNAGETTIDGPTQSTVYTIKQIGTGQIADGAITQTKPAESFMKRVTLLDDGLGNAKGWNPNGATRNFIIDEPEVSGPFGDSIFFTIEVQGTSGDPASPANFSCDVIDHNALINEFIVGCESSPSQGAELHYVVGKLPPHVF